MEKVEKIFKDINILRFTKLIKYDNPLNQTYNSVENEYKHNVFFCGRNDIPTGVCNLCENNSANKSPDRDFSLKIVSHGIHSLDLFKKQNFTDYSDYRDDGVMLIMESPSKNLDACYFNAFDNSNGKHAAKVWWWLESDATDHPTEYPNGFSSKKYGEFFNSFVHTFKLKNAYMTNFIKCGMLNNSDDNKFGNFTKFTDDCKRICFENFFLEEIKIIKPKVIFTLSGNVYKYLNNNIEKIQEKAESKPLIIQLPHPARSRQGFLNEYYRTLWYCRTLEGLIITGIISNKNEQHNYWDNYIRKI